VCESERGDVCHDRNGSLNEQREGRNQSFFFFLYSGLSSNLPLLGPLLL
jgi:hypothetical protein